MRNGKVITLLVLIFTTFAADGQEYLDLLNDPNERDFKKIRTSAKAYFENRDKGRGSGYKQWMRTEYILGSRLDANGLIVNASAANQKALKAFETYNPEARSINGLWEPMGPDAYIREDSYDEFSGLGRLNDMTVHPDNPNILYVGAPVGGLWKSTDAGNSWTPLTDGIPQIGISGIEIHPDIPGTIYILTGDGDGRDNPSSGVLKSSNGGVTWTTTALQWSPNQLVRGYKLLMHPDNPDTMFVASSDGLYRTDDGFATPPVRVLDGLFHDVEFKPFDPEVVYAARKSNGQNSDFMRSGNHGKVNTWAEINPQILDTIPHDRIAIAVTPAAPSTVYLLYATNAAPGYRALARSQTNGSYSGWQIQSTTPNVMGWSSTGITTEGSQAHYDIALEVSKIDADEIWLGGINVWHSDNAGVNWTIQSHWADEDNEFGYTHADIHFLEFINNKLYCTSDGGIFVSDDEGENWVDKTQGIQILMAWDFDVEQGEIVAGTQDNGSLQWNTSTTLGVAVKGGDGGSARLDYSNTDIRYVSTQSTRYKSTNGGDTYPTIIDPPLTDSTDLGGNIADFILHPTDPMKLINSFNDIWHSSDRGATWTGPINPGFVNDEFVIDIEQGVDNSDRVYATDYVSMFRTDNFYAGTPTWNNVRPNVPESVRMREIETDPTNSLNVWACFLGYVDTVKVFRSQNGGMTWENISEGLPNVPVSAIRYEPGSNGGIYVGTDIGVFYRNDDIDKWIPFLNGLPHVTVRNLVIDGSYLYAGTYGRGIWRSPLISTCPAILNLTNANLPSSPGTMKFNAGSQIASTQTFFAGAGTDITYESGGYVRLDPGFEIRPEAIFEAKIGGCPTVD